MQLMRERSGQSRLNESEEHVVRIPRGRSSVLKSAVEELGGMLVDEPEGIVYPDLSWSDELAALRHLTGDVRAAWQDRNELSVAGFDLLKGEAGYSGLKLDTFVERLLGTLDETLDKYPHSNRRLAYNRTITKLTPKDMRIVVATFCLDGQYFEPDKITRSEGLRINSFFSVSESCSHLHWTMGAEEWSSGRRRSLSEVRDELHEVALKQVQG